MGRPYHVIPYNWFWNVRSYMYFSIAIFWIMIQIFIKTPLVWYPKSRNRSSGCLFLTQTPVKYLDKESIISWQLNENWISTNDSWIARYTVSIFRASFKRTDHQANGILYIYTVESYSSQRLLVERVCSKLKEPFHVRFNHKSWHETSDVVGGGVVHARPVISWLGPVIWSWEPRPQPAEGLKSAYNANSLPTHIS